MEIVILHEPGLGYLPIYRNSESGREEYRGEYKATPEEALQAWKTWRIKRMPF